MNDNSNDTFNGITEHKALIAEAHSEFQQSVIHGISKLRESGVSKQRAIEILLTFLRQDDDVPTDEEIFQVMYTLRLGYHHAMQCLIVAKAVSRIQQKGALEKAQAIQSLSEHVTKYIQDFSIPTILDNTKNMDTTSHPITTEDVAYLNVNLSTTHVVTTTRKGPSTPISKHRTTNSSSTTHATIMPAKPKSIHASIRKHSKNILPTRTTKPMRKRKEEQEEKVAAETKDDRETIRRSSPKVSTTRNKRSREDEMDTTNGNGIIAGGGHCGHGITTTTTTTTTTTMTNTTTSGTTNGVPETILVDGTLMVPSKRPRLDSV
jgi:hypothetical protein